MKSYEGVICGDSDQIIDEMIRAGEKYDLILTDPPYNINKDFGNDSDKLSVEEFIDITNKRIEKLKQVLNPYGSIIWFGIHDYIGYIQIAMYNAGLSYRRVNIWHYESYVWVNSLDNKAYSRVVAQKHNIRKFFKDPTIDINKTEREIMESHGYARVYDSGTITWEWKSQ